MTETGTGPSGGKRSFLDDIAGMAGGAFSALNGMKAEAEAMMRAQMEAMTQRLDLVKREDLDAAMEVARRASEAAETLAARVTALEARIASMDMAASPAVSGAYLEDPKL
ncbi:accessory factor UbiK family protein [Plastoroseomonas arctica]|uniref:Accessory factor UbiK family protein n=1 Tax=Plastoroseomonas arctica TaxID=1509237 RepID=A0AAF1KLS6_9PROT|nr:accessory factor UbiK family protein [Plastoroseomonas arctica]MBR0655121.1 accessory factor UbiK family protein [Plastoroseomonas arctica]